MCPWPPSLGSESKSDGGSAALKSVICLSSLAYLLFYPGAAASVSAPDDVNTKHQYSMCYNSEYYQWDPGWLTLSFGSHFTFIPGLLKAGDYSTVQSLVRVDDDDPSPAPCTAAVCHASSAQCTLQWIVGLGLMLSGTNIFFSFNHFLNQKSKTTPWTWNDRMSHISSMRIFMHIYGSSSPVRILLQEQIAAGFLKKSEWSHF